MFVEATGAADREGPPVTLETGMIYLTQRGKDAKKMVEERTW
jgi:hypothetical protein